MRGRSIRAMSALEVLIAAVVGLSLLGIAGWTLVSTSRISSRGQNKLFDTAQSELLLRFLEEDLHCLEAMPVVADEPPQLVLDRRASSGRVQVEWRFVPTADGSGSSVRRTVHVDKTQQNRPDWFCVGMLNKAVLKPISVPGHPGLAVHIVCKTINDATPAGFSGTFFYHNENTDKNWNVIPTL